MYVYKLPFFTGIFDIGQIECITIMDKPDQYCIRIFFKSGNTLDGAGCSSPNIIRQKYEEVIEHIKKIGVIIND